MWAAHTQLATLHQLYTAEHAEVTLLREQLDAMVAQRDALMRDLAAAGAGGPGGIEGANNAGDAAGDASAFDFEDLF